MKIQQAKIDNFFQKVSNAICICVVLAIVIAGIF